MDIRNLVDAQYLLDTEIPNISGAWESGFMNQTAPAAEDAVRNGRKVLLWLIDLQNDFVKPPSKGATLSVNGAIESLARTNSFILNNLDQITDIYVSLDTHLPFQIFFPTWWRNSKGDNPPPFTLITANDVVNGVWQPQFYPAWSVQYVQDLEQSGKKTLCIWPPHCLAGTWGNAMVAGLAESLHYWAASRTRQLTPLVKGNTPRTEFYSILEPEVKDPQHPMGSLNTGFLDASQQYDLIYVAGQAKTHCVLETVRSAMTYFGRKDPATIKKFRFLNDATDPITGLGLEKPTEDALNRYAQQGMKIVNTTDAIA